MIESASPIPLWLDTDIGDDVDDALALALILNTPQLALRGISTVYIDTPRRARLARKILAAWRRDDVPVTAGCSRPLIEPIRSQEGRQFAVLDDEGEQQETLNPMRGVQALVEAIESQAARGTGEKLTVLAIGALTNIALAVALRPDLIGYLRLYMMGGQGIEGQEAEWNIRCDPEAAAMVFASGVEIRQVSYDITTQVQLSETHLDRIAGHESERIALIWRLISLWRGANRNLPYLHDPLAALALFDNCVRFEPRSATVELCGDRRAMIAYTEPDTASTPVQVAVEVDAERAIDRFMQGLLS